MCKKVALKIKLNVNNKHLCTLKKIKYKLQRLLKYMEKFLAPEFIFSKLLME